ncbi:MAG: hypothetical protein ACI4ES_03525, partial [Roseburia sp.]
FSIIRQKDIFFKFYPDPAAVRNKFNCSYHTKCYSSSFKSYPHFSCFSGRYTHPMGMWNQFLKFVDKYSVIASSI